jgi:cytochrome b561
MAKLFPVPSRILHWAMAALILAMLFIGIAMVSSLADYHRLVAIHKPLGVLILILVAFRLVNRLINPPPPLPNDMPFPLRLAAHGSHWLLYGLMLALPLVGWGMLSAANYPIALVGSLHLPWILPHSDALYASLRSLHTVLAFLLFATFLAHLGAAPDACADLPRRRVPEHSVLAALSIAPCDRARIWPRLAIGSTQAFVTPGRAGNALQVAHDRRNLVTAPRELGQDARTGMAGCASQSNIPLQAVDRGAVARLSGLISGSRDTQ